MTRDEMGGGDALAAGTRLEEFELECELGASGFGVTYLAHDRSLDRQVAINEYLPRDWSTRGPDGGVGPRSAKDAEDYRWGLDRFLEEARVLARLHHAHVVQVYRVIEARGTAYLVTEYVEGRSLAEALRAEGPWPEPRVVSLLDALTADLAAVHGAGLVHRDIKPANVMLREDGSPVLIDFGSARQAVSGRSRGLTEVLTPGYAPIEQYSKKGRQGPWTDVYALGAVAYEALSGRVPEEATERALEDSLQPVAEAASQAVSARLSSAVMSALALRWQDRPQSLAEWRALLGKEPAEREVEGTSTACTDDLGTLGRVGGPAPGSVREEPDVLTGGGQDGRVASMAAGEAVAAGEVEDTGATDTDRLDTPRRASRPRALRIVVVVALALGVAVTWWTEAERQRLAADAAVAGQRLAAVATEAAATAEAERQRLAELYLSGRVFRDCDGCPEMVVVPTGAFMMGSWASEEVGPSEYPRHWVTLRSFALGVTEVTFDEWEACVLGFGCNGYRPDDRGWGWGARPVINVSWEEARAYVRWLSRETGESYRLPSESEWEYAARAGTTTPFHTGATISTDRANYYGSDRRRRYRRRTTPVKTFAPNTFGLHDMHGNVYEWVEDCWHDSYRGAPNDGAAWTAGGDCGRRVLRGGSWNGHPMFLRSAARLRSTTELRLDFVGFRVARTLD